MTDDRDIHEILRDAQAIADQPETGEPTAGVPALVVADLASIDPTRVCFFVHEGHPVTVWPKGQRPHG